MSTARLIPETWELTGDDARKTLAHTGRRRLLADAFQRLRSSDGFSHSRSLAFMLTLSAIQGLIALVGLVSAFGANGIGEVIQKGIKAAAPGPVASLLSQAVGQAEGASTSHNYLGLIFGSIGWLITTTTAMGQLERGLNRLYGVEQDRPSVKKYGFAFLLALSVGALLSLALGVLAFGRTIGASIHNGVLSALWNAGSWPIGLVLTGSAIALLFRWCPRRHQPTWSWLAFGSAVSMLLWFGVTLLLGIFFRHSASFGKTYGPLAGVVALMLWALLSSISLLYGAAVAAQLEAVRAHAATPQDAQKVAASEPDASAA